MRHREAEFVVPGARKRSVLFYSDRNPLGTNPDGSQVFAMRWNGSHLRQLTRARGTTRAADGRVAEVEIPSRWPA